MHVLYMPLRWIAVRTSCLVLISFLTYANANAIFPRRCLTAVCQMRSPQTVADVSEFSRCAAVLAKAFTYTHTCMYCTCVCACVCLLTLTAAFK